MQSTSETATKRPGRPMISDALVLYLFTEMERRRRGVSMRKLTSDRRLVFRGKLNLPAHDGYSPRPPIGGGTLRRRFGHAQQELGLTDYTPGFRSSAQDEVRREVRTILDRMMADLAD